MTDEPERMACEARWCLHQPKEARLAYYRMVEAKRGTESAQALIEAVKEEFLKNHD